MVMGATTYAWIGARLGDTGEAWPYAVPCFVFTHRQLGAARRRHPVRPPGAGRAARHPRGCGRGRDVWVVGGGALAADLAEAGMLDEALVSLAPVTLGSGRPLLPRPFELRLRESGRNGAFLDRDVRRGGST